MDTKSLWEMKTKIYHREKSIILTKNIGTGCTIHAHVWIGNVKIGKNCKIQAFSFIPEGVTLEDDVFIGPGVVFTNDKYPPSKDWKKTLVRQGVSIGANATILPGVTIGLQATIGAGAVVTKSIPNFETWVGNPAKKIKKREIMKYVFEDGTIDRPLGWEVGTEEKKLR